MSDNGIDRWIVHLRALADQAVGNPADVPGAAEVAPIIESVLAGDAQSAPTPCARDDVGLWWAAVDDSIDVDSILDDGTDGPLFRVDRFKAIEVWTESELSGLHALDTTAAKRGDASLRRIVERARDWHLANTQPDNATNRPWALHVFLTAGAPESRLYAETLLHNCMAISGRPDPFSALILRHAASRLE